MTITEFLLYCRKLNIQIWVDNGKIHYHAPKEVLTPLLRQTLSNRKEEIIQFHNELLQQESYEKQLSYWEQQLAGAPLILELPSDRSRPEKPTWTTSSQTITFSKSLTESLRKVSNQQGVKLFVFMLAAFKTLLYRYTNNDDFLVGTRIFNSDRIADPEKKLGFFANTLVLRSKMTDNQTFRQFLADVDKLFLEAQRNPDVTLEKILERFAASENKNYNPLFQVMFVMQDFKKATLETIDIFQTTEKDENKVKVDLCLTITDELNRLSGVLEYNNELFDSETITRMSGHFNTLLEGIVSNIDSEIYCLPILTEMERRQLFIDWNSNRLEYPENKLLHELFEEQVERTPSVPAVIFRNEEIKYEDLNKRANQLAHRLQKMGVGPEVPVGVFLERSLNTVISLLAILKAGGGYIPLDLCYPPTHIQFIMEQSKLLVLISEEKLKQRLPEHTASIVYIDSDWSDIATASTENIINDATPDNLTLIMYTSGSTGIPKGVAHGQRVLLNLFSWYWHNYPFQEDEKVCQRTTVNFIPSMWELLGALLQGFPTVIIPDEVAKDPVRLVRMLSEHEITRITVVPSLLRIILDVDLDLEKYLPKLKYVETLGEPLTLNLYNQFRNRLPHVVLLNDYGSTETDSSLFFDSRMQAGEMSSVPIGRPISNMEVYILDHNYQPVPVGIPGQIYLGGISLARGYLNRPDLTDERFVPHPFSDEPGARIYNMGDIARYLPDGTVECLGRRDHQVKIRGARVELTEIDIVLGNHPAVLECVVDAREKESGSKYLVAFVVLKEGSNCTTGDLREFLKSGLPAYMVPSFFVILDHIPRTPNGKVDRKSLPDIGTASQKTNQTQSDLKETKAVKKDNYSKTNSIELLKEIKIFLQDVMVKSLEINISELDDTQKFFDIGVDSIVAVKIIKAINDKFELDLSVTILFDYSSIDDLAKYLTTLSRNPEDNTTVLDTLEKCSVNSQQYQDLSENVADKSQTISTEDIAVIGIAGRFPGAKDKDQFWTNLINGVMSISEVPRERWNPEEYYTVDSQETNKTVSKWGGFVEDIDKFDSAFFNISPLEAEYTDPQQRLCLEECYKVFEDAGYAGRDFAGKRVGVFIGVRRGDYIDRIRDSKMHPNGHILMGNDSAILAARISYYLNLKGPNLSIDTACSSSLVAVHLACQSIHTGECEMALAGGVSILTSPEFYVMCSNMGMLSPEGKCKTFDNTADGFVIGEGVGVVLLKPLKRALDDGDNIYGIIRGSGMNQDGKTNGITAPSKESQTSLHLDVYRRYNINPESIGLMEAHGTGTKLGDPIEIEALTEAFGNFTEKKQYCAIGSVKSNIGHSIASAGIFGLIKSLLCIKHKLLVPTINYNEQNEHINFINSPFYVSTKLKRWEALKDYPRRAAVSSFGFSGTNCHMVVEEYDNVFNKNRALDHGAQIIVLSAASEDRLRAYTQEMVIFLEKLISLDSDKYSLSDIAYTLQMGREAMNERLAVIVDSIQETVDKLKDYLEGKKSIKDFYKGHVNRDEDNLTIFAADEDMAKTIDAWVSKRKYSKVLNFWVKGYPFDWNKLYSGFTPNRVSLPTYPFARERYWVSEINSNASITTTSCIHPLLHQNTSNLSEQRFSSTLTGQEILLSDHIVKGDKVLPGVAHLEMARAAVDQATKTLRDASTGINLKDIIWARPLIINDQPVQVHISLFPDTNGDISYEIYTESIEKDAGIIVHSQGKAVLSPIKKAPTIDIRELQAECSPKIISSSRCYEAFKEMGLDYGPAYQGIENVYVGSGKVLAKLSLPSSVRGIQEQFILHPSLMDSAVQASIGLMIGSDDSITSCNLGSPFALQKLEVFSNPTATMWVLVKYSNENSTGEKLEKIDIDICDEQGTICVRMNGFTRVMEEKNHIENVSNGNNTSQSSDLLVGNVILTPVWDVVPLEQEKHLLSPDDKILVVGRDEVKRENIKQIFKEACVLDIQPDESIKEIAKKLKGHDSIKHIVWVASYNELKSLTEDTLIEDQEKEVLQLFRFIKILINLGYGTKNLKWTVITIQSQPVCKNDELNTSNSSLHGLIGSMAKEYQNWKIRVVDVEANNNWPVSDIFNLPYDSQGNAWVYRKKEWYRQLLIPVDTSKLDQTLYKTGGVYVVIGGAGGIGEVWTEYMIRTYQAQIIWLGRRKNNESIQEKIDRLATLGPVPHYIVADGTDRQALQRAYEEIKSRYSLINGVIHSAVGIMDESLANMDEERFKAVLSAKVDISVRIAQVFQNEPLDFIMFFSSISSFLKPHGQSGYASGCTFQDSYAYQLTHEWPCAVKVVNWGYWGEIGIGGVVPPAFKNRMSQAGIGTIDPSEAIEALETLLVGPVNQIALLKTTKPWAMEGVNPEVLIKVYPENIPSLVQSTINKIIIQDSEVQHIKSEGVKHKKELDELLCKMLRSQLQSIGLFTKNKISMEDLKIAGLHSLYERWIEESIAILARNNYLSCDGETYTVVDKTPVDLDSLWKEWDYKKELWLESPNLKAQVILLEKMMRALPDVLTGKRPAGDVMFPDSTMELVEGIYKDNPVSDYFNEIVADTVVNYIEERSKIDPSVRINIIEIGAGTGGTSATVFRKLKPHREYINEYCYTDISKAFLMHAEKEYGQNNPYIIYKIFDVEESIAGQGITAGGYDIVICTNVLHATKNIRQTLRNTKAVLKKHGLLILNEISANSLFTHLTFGLLKGWWLYEDKETRIPGCPGLFPETWQDVLEGEGFPLVFFPAHNVHGLGYQIIVAESDGILRQKQQLNTRAISLNQSSKIIEQPGKQKFPTAQRVETTKDLLREKTVAYITKLVADTVRIHSEKVDPSEPLEKYGIDSILIVQMTNKLRKVFDNISATLFFEYQSIDALVEHLIKTHKESLITLLGLDAQRLKKQENEETEELAPPNLMIKSGRFLQFRGQETIKTESESSWEPIAIIGMSGRYPGANNLKEYWNNLKAGKDCITQIPEERWPLEGFYHQDRQEAVAQGKSYSKWGGFIEGFANFDPRFFNISPREALHIDPQERLFLEECWKVLEDAGYTREQLAKQYKGRIGVFAGVTKAGFSLFGPELWKQGEKIYPRTSFSSVANRVSYLFNLRGPSLPIDTMCSSSLTAIHEAFEHIQRGDCEMAIAGGVNLYLHPLSYVELCAHQMLSEDGQCKSFGRGGNGFVPGEGVGTVLLKRLSKAITDQDHIYAVIRGSKINHGGKTNGYTVPNPIAQAGLIKDAIVSAGVNATTISYVEAHGTGTELGDPIEIAGLTQAFQSDIKETGYCSIGSVKTNIGHLEAAAGIAGLTKIVLQMQHRQIVPSLHSRELNPNINFSETPFTVQQELTEWKRPLIEIDGKTKEYPRIAGIPSYGAGGSNAYMLIEEYIPQNLEHPHIAINTENPAIIVLSAKNEERLQEQVMQMINAIRNQQFSNSNLANLAYTLQVGREAMDERLAVIVTSIEELEEKLKGFTEGKESIEDMYRGQVNRNKDTLDIFAADEELQEAVGKWIQRRKYGKLLEFWVRGLTFEWNLIYGHSKPSRISVPTYPFARECYWLPKIKPKFESSNQNRTPSRDESTSSLTQSFSNLSDKPGRITLPSLSDHPRTLSKSLGQTSQLITLTPKQVEKNMTEPFKQTIQPTELQGENKSIQPYPVESLREELAVSLAEVLHVKRSEIERDKKLIDMGLDSILGVEWIRVINLQYGVSIQATKIYDYPTILDFAEFLKKQLNKKTDRIPYNETVILKSESLPEPSNQSVQLPSLESAIASEISIPLPAESQEDKNTLLSLPLESLQEELATSLAEVLYIERSDVEMDKKLIDMGLDSILGVEWIRLINQRFGTSIPATKIYDYPTIIEFAGFLKKATTRHIGESTTATKINSSNSISELLQQVYEGTLAIEQARQLLQK